MKTNIIINRDALFALKELPDESVHCAVTSPPYYALRDYGLDAQIGREDTPEQYIERLTEVFHELKRVLRSDGTFWLNIADTYCGTGSKGGCTDPKNPKGRNGQSVSIARKAAGCKQKDLIGIPWLLAFALRADGWYLRPKAAKTVRAAVMNTSFCLRSQSITTMTLPPLRSLSPQQRRRGTKGRAAQTANMPKKYPDKERYRD